MKRCCTICSAIAVLALAGCSNARSGTKTYDFTQISQGNIERTVSSSGSLKVVSAVKVLPQMSGKVEKVNVDYNDMVKKGDILAELNTDVLKLQRDQQLSQVRKSRANYELQELNYRNQAALAQKNLISDYELKTSKTNLDIMAADLATAEANLKQIETEINQYAFISSPIDGIVLERNINAGDSVVESSNSNTTNIFTVAENLREMQIEAGVGELDISSIIKGQAVRFTLESLPGRIFRGEVETIRLVPAVSNNVVSYTVIINVENQDGSLLPGMTCAVDFIAEQKQNVMMAPNAALRYSPTSLTADEIAAMVFEASLAGMSEEEKAAAIERRNAAPNQAQGGQGIQIQGNGISSLIGGPMMGGQRQFRGPGQGAQNNQNAPIQRPALTYKNLWYIGADGKLSVIRVQTGITNGTFTEIITDEYIEGMEFIMRERV